jgi:hypothetical protein
LEHVYGTFVLALAGAFCLLTTWSAVTSPAEFAGRLGLAVSNAGGVNEVRAQYGGFFCAIAIACLASMYGAVSRHAVYLLLMVTFGGLIAGRLVSFVLNRGVAGFPRTILALYVIDAIGFGLSTVAFTGDRNLAFS